MPRLPMPRACLSWLPFIALAFAVVAVFGVDVPREDDWFLPPLLAEGALNLYNVFAPANEHRIVVSRLISLALAYGAGWNVKLYMYVNVAAATTAFLLVARIAWRQTSGEERNPVFHLANVLSCALMLSAAQHEAWLFGANMPWHLTTLLAIAGIALLTDPRATPDRSRQLGAALSCTLASFSAAHGLLTWPALAPLLAGADRRRAFSRVAAWLALGAVVTALYLAGLRGTPVQEIVRTVDDAAGRLPLAVLTLLGAPWFSHALAAPATGAALALGLAATLAGPGRVRWPQAAPWICLALFSALSALAIAGGRVELDAAVGLTERYLPPATLFSVAVMQLLRARLRTATNRRAPLVFAAAGALLCAILVRSLGALDAAAAHTRINRQLAACLTLVHQAPRGCLGHVHPDLQTLPKEVALVEARGLRTFERKLPLVDVPAEPGGYIDVPAPNAAPARIFRGHGEATSVRVSGWAAVRGRRRPAPIVLFTYNDERRFFAVARVELPRPDVAHLLNQASARDSGWATRISAAVLPTGPGTIHAWTWDRPGRRFVRIAGEVHVVVLE